MSITDVGELLGTDPVDPQRPRTIVRRPNAVDRWVFRGGTRAVALSTLLILFLIGFFLFWKGLPAFRSQGWHFFSNTGFQTQPTAAGPPQFGIRAALTGTVVTSMFAMVIGVPVAIAAALFISEYAPQRIKAFATSLIDLLAAVPSVVYGLWGFIFLSPHMVGVAKWLSVHVSFIPIFHVTTPLFTSSQFIAGTILGLMVVPIVASISREVFSLTPIAEREGALALGASRATVVRRVVIPFARGGLIGAIMLGLGRAMGEAIAVAIILSLDFSNPYHILQVGGTTIASLIAVRFGSGGALGLPALLAAGFSLFVFTLIVNSGASFIVNRSRSASAVEL
jgi:phosphate transport system permease protein